jgi:aspartyl-tRNA(Asn)/glutamyl-tRNA(Gln) amidotransferase subunit B
MSIPFDKYEVVIGLEVHAQMSTESKAYSPDPTIYGEPPNTNIHPITLGHPGTLPKMNRKTVENAIKMGLAVGSEIRHHNEFARKNYFYADLPKGYQITQDTTPICNGGEVLIQTDAGEKRIGITRIHMEEDAGKSIHDLDPYNTLIDLNRAGVPLIEIVSEPDMRSSDEAYAYLSEIRKLVRFLEICDGNMEEGSLRCDANVSVRPKGQKEFGTRAEVKNMNSLRNVKRAIDHEVERQIQLVESGGTVVQQTRTFDPVSGTTTAMRDKEQAHDYRYFPEPDLPPIVLTDEDIAKVRASMPALPRELKERFMNEYGLSEYDADVLTEDKAIALFFDDLAARAKNVKAAANWMLGPVKSYLNEKALEMEAFPLLSAHIIELVDLIEEGKTNFSIASQRIFPVLLEQPGKTALGIAEELNLIQSSDTGFIEELIDEVLAKYPEKVEEYKAGKKGLLGLFVGEVMKASKGKADPKMTNQILNEKLK